MNVKLIEFLKEDLKLRHSKRSNKLTVTIDREDKTARTVDELVALIKGHSNIYKNNSNWQQFKAAAMSELKDGDDFYEELSEILKEHIAYILSAKTNAAKNIQANIEASAFNSFVKDLAEMPKVGFSSIDKIILSRFRYCQADTCIYVKKDGSLKLIGKLESLKKDPTQAGLCALVKEEIGRQWNEGVPMKLDEYVSLCLKTVTELRHFIIAETKKKIDAGEDFKEVVIDIDGEKFKPSEKCYAEDVNALENSAHNYCIEKLWSMVPCSIFTARVVTVKAVFNTYEIAKPDGGVYKVNDFVKYIYDVVRSGDALTEATYLKNIFSVYAAELKDDESFKLDEVPRTYADGDAQALFMFDGDALKEQLSSIGCYTKLEDCKNLTLMKSWMNEDEFRLMMAWAYAAIHPCTVKSNIALLLWTGGGTGKSSIVAMIKYAMMMAAKAREEDLYFEIKGDKFDEDTRNWIPDGEIGLVKAALVNIDEATTKSIELYKDFSGSADKNRLNIRLNYENALTYDIKGKFIFTTNKGLQLTSDDGSLLRRVAIIKHAEVKNIIGDEPKTNEEIVLEYKKQIPVLMALGKKALQEIIELGYPSIDSYAMKCENITKNLKESTAVTMNVQIYEWIWQKLVEEHPMSIREDNTARLQGSALKKLYDDVCTENSEDSKFYSAFKRFIIEQFDNFTEANERKQARDFLAWIKYKDEANAFRWEIIDKNCNSIYILHPLKKETSNEE